MPSPDTAPPAARETTPAVGESHAGWLSLYGPFLLALYFVMTTRWGSYLLPGPPYIGDVALAILIVHRLWQHARREAPAPLIGRIVGAATASMLAYAVVRLALGDLNITALRDAAPYLYAVLVFFGQPYRAIAPRVVEGFVYGALVMHLVWYTASEAFPSVASVQTLGDSTVFLLQGRADIDGAFLGVLVGLTMNRTFLGHTSLLSAAIGGWALTMVLLTQSRASFLAAVAAVGFMLIRQAIIWRARRQRSVDAPAGSRRRWPAALNPALVAVMLVGVPLVITVVSGTPAPLSRSLDTVQLVDGEAALGPTTDPITGLPLDPVTGEVIDPKVDNPDSGDSSPDSGTGEVTDPKVNGDSADPRAGRPPDPADAAANTGYATAVARTEGWKKLVSWLHDDGASRWVVGVGFGPHYLQQSGADVAFLGADADPSVRAVHNFGLNTWARLGLVGVLLEGLILLLSLVAAVRLSMRVVDPPLLDVFASLLVVVIPVVAFLGVVLESPFGAIPFFWAAGYLSARMVDEGLWRPLPLPRRLSGSGT